jgi:hypothetical protein
MLSVNSIDDASNVSYSVAQVLGGFINRDPNGANRTDTLPTANQIIAGLGGSTNVPVGTSVQLTIRNTADALETITVEPGPGLTIIGDKDIVQNNMKKFLIVVTSYNTISVYTLGSLDYNS